MKAVEGRTLHVLTEAYAIGGHTPLVKRWIELLDDEPHAVVLVRQGQPVEHSWVVPLGRHVPVIDLHQAHLSRRARVAHLQALFRVARRVILHIHPNDACSVAAAYRSPHAEIHFLNHADHVAWLGAGLPAVLLNLRHRGARLAEVRRGVAAAACGVVPVPITRPAVVDRHEARQSFGIGDHECLVLTVASGYKFNPVGSRSLLEALDRLLRRRDVKLMAVGVDDRHPVFGPLAERHPGQVLCMGTVPSPTRHRAAADIYLDSYPFCSITSMLESAALGTPVVAYQPDPEELEILYSECPWLPADRHPARDAGQLVESLDALIDDRSLRQDFSVRTIAGMEQHSPPAWRAAMRRHLAGNFAKTPWRKPDRPFRDGLLDRLLLLPGVELSGPDPRDPAAPNRLPHHISLLMAAPGGKPLSGRRLVQTIWQQGYAVSSGSACSSGRGANPWGMAPSPILQAMGYPDPVAASGLRISLGPWLTGQDLEGVPGAVERGKLRVIAGEPVG
jgi:glycosyltransferase involved in cell wall biosynthesis